MTNERARMSMVTFQGIDRNLLIVGETGEFSDFLGRPTVIDLELPDGVVVIEDTADLWGDADARDTGIPGGDDRPGQRDQSEGRDLL